MYDFQDIEQLFETQNVKKGNQIIKMSINSKSNQFQISNHSHDLSPYLNQNHTNQVSAQSFNNVLIYKKSHKSHHHSSSSLHFDNHNNKNIRHHNFNESLVLNAKCLIANIEQQVQMFLERKADSGNHNQIKIAHKIKVEIQRQLNQIVKIVRKLPSSQRNQLIIQLLACLTPTDSSFLSHIPTDQIINTFVYLNHQFQTHLKHSQSLNQYSNSNDNDKHADSQRFVPSQLKTNKKLHVSNSLHNLQKAQTIVDNNETNRPLINKNPANSQETKSFKNFIETLALNRIDSILMYVLSDKKTKEALLSKGSNAPDIIQSLLDGLQNPLISKKLQLLYAQSQFQSHLSSIQSLSFELSNFFQVNIIEETDIKQVQTSDLTQIQLLQRDIRQLMAQQLQSKSKKQYHDANQTHQSSQSSDKFIRSNLLSLQNSYSLPKKFTKSPIQTFHFTSRGNPTDSNNKKLSLGYLTNRNKKLKYSTNGFIINSSTNKNQGYQSNEIKETNSPSKCSQSPKNNNLIVQTYEQKQFTNQLKLSKSDSKGMNYNKVIPLRNSFIAGRSSILTNSLKNGMGIHNNMTNFGSFGNVPNQFQEQGFSKNVFGIKIPNSTNSNFNKQTKLVQRRSGFVGLSKKRQPSTKRISTRWNNCKQGLSNLFSESSFKKIEDGSNFKAQIKSKFSLSNKNNKQKINSYDQRQDSSLSSSRSEESNINKKNSNDTQISFVGYTYNFFNYDKFSVPKLETKQSSLTLSNRNILIIDEKFQDVRCKLFYIRLMTLLNQVLKIVITQTYVHQKYNASSRKYRNKVQNHQQKQIKTVYDSKYQINLNINQKKNFTKFLGQFDTKQQRKKSMTSKVQYVCQGLTKINKNQKKQFNDVQNKLKQIMNKYLSKKEQSFQENVKKCIKQIQQTQNNKKMIENKVLKDEQQLIIKPFCLFLQIQNEEGCPYQRNCNKRKSKSIMSYVMGSHKIQSYKNEKGAGIKCTQISLKYQDETESDRKIMFQDDKSIQSTSKCQGQRSELQLQQKKGTQCFLKKKYSTLNNLNESKNSGLKKAISILEPQEEKVPIKIVQVPASIIIKNDFQDRIIYKKIQLVFSLSIQPNKQLNKSKKSNKKSMYKSDQKSNKTQSSKFVSGYFGTIEQDDDQNQCFNQFNDRQKQPEQQSQSSSFQVISQNDSGDASDEGSNSSSKEQNLSPSSKSQSNKGSDKLSENQSQNESSSSQKNLTSSSKNSPQVNQRLISQSLSVDSQTISSNSKTNHHHIFINKRQNLAKARIRKSKHGWTHMHWKQKDFSTQAFKDGYFSIQKIIQKLLLLNFKAVKTQMGTKFCLKSTQNASKTSFQSTRNKPSTQVRQIIKISKFSSTLKNLLEALPRDLFQIEQILSKYSIEQSNRKRTQKSDFVNFVIEIKVDNETVQEKISQKKLIKLKYNKQTSKKSMFKLSDNSVIIHKTYEKVNLIRKINTYFFLKDILLITSKDDQAKKQLHTVLYEQIYCETFHELYERQFIEFVQINSLTKEQNKNFPNKTKNVSFLFEKKFRNIFYTQKLKKLKKLMTRPSNQNQTNLSPNDSLFFPQNTLISYQQKSKKGFQPTKMQLYSVSVQQIPEVYSKTEILSLEFVEYYTYNEFCPQMPSLTGNHLHFANKDKLTSVFTYAEKLSKIKLQDKKNYLTKHQTGVDNNQSKVDFNIINSLLEHNFMASKQSQSKIIQNSSCQSHSCNIKRRMNKRTTLDINKINQTSQLSSQTNNLNLNHKNEVDQKQKRMFGFIKAQSFKKFPTLDKDLFNEGTHKQIVHQTQKSLKSHHSKTRLHRQAYHINSLIPTSSKYLKSSKNYDFNSKETFKKRTHCPSLSVSLNVYNEYKSRKKIKKPTFRGNDNFIDLQSNQVQSKSKEELLKTKSKWGDSKQNYKVQLIKKNQFYKKKNASFKTFIKRSKKFVLCYVQWWAASQSYFQVQILVGMYALALSPLKIVSGKIHNILFKEIFKSHQNLSNYINCQIDCPFQINAGPMQDCLSQISRLRSLNQSNLHEQTKIRPNLRIQKMIKVRLISRFVKKFNQNSGIKNSQSKSPSCHYIVVTIFVYDSLPNQSVYFHLYIPKSSKNYVFVIQGSIFYYYLNEWIDQYSKDKNVNDSIKNSMIEKQSEKQIVVIKNKRTPRLSIFSPLSQISHKQAKSQEDFLGLPIKTNENLGSFQFFSGKDPFRSMDSNLSLKKKSSSICESEREQANKDKNQQRIYEAKQEMNWKQVCRDILKFRKKIKFNQLFQIDSQNDSYLVQFNHKKKVKFLGVEILSKKVHFKIEEEYDDKIKQKKLNVVPDAIEIVSLQYSQKKFSLLNSFNPDAFSMIKIKQSFTKYQMKLQNSHYFSYNLEELLMKNQFFNKGIRKSITKSLFTGQKQKNFEKLINEQRDGMNYSQKSHQEKKNVKDSAGEAKGRKLQKKVFQSERKYIQTSQLILTKTKETQSLANIKLFNKQQIPYCKNGLLKTVVNSRDLLSSFIKKYNPQVKHKSILYSELLNEFRGKCEIKSYKIFESNEKRQKNQTIFIKQANFCSKKSTMQVNLHKDKLTSNNNVSFDLGRSFIRLKFNKFKQNENQQANVDISRNKPNQRIEVFIHNLFGQNICQFDTQKMQELFPFATQFSSLQMKKFLKRIFKDQRTIEYLKIKNPPNIDIK